MVVDGEFRDNRQPSLGGGEALFRDVSNRRTHQDNSIWNRTFVQRFLKALFCRGKGRHLLFQVILTIDAPQRNPMKAKRCTPAQSRANHTPRHRTSDINRRAKRNQRYQASWLQRKATLASRHDPVICLGAFSQPG